MKIQIRRNGEKQEEEEIYNLAFLLFVCNDHLFWLPNIFILVTVFKLSLQVSYTQSQNIYSLNNLAGEKQDKPIRKNSYGIRVSLIITSFLNKM